MSEFTPKRLTSSGESKAMILAKAYEALDAALAAALNGPKHAQLAQSIKSHSNAVQAALLLQESEDIATP